MKEENEQQEAIAESLRKDLAQLYASVSFIAYLFAYQEVVVNNFSTETSTFYSTCPHKYHVVRQFCSLQPARALFLQHAEHLTQVLTKSSENDSFENTQPWRIKSPKEDTFDIYPGAQSSAGWSLKPRYFLHFQLHQMRLENETCKEIERLKDSEFTLDPEEQKKQEALIEQEVNRVTCRSRWECKEIV